MRKITFFITLIISTLLTKGQPDTLQIYRISQNQAIEIALKHNLRLSNSRLEIEKNKWQIWETTAMGLPQANAQIQFQDFLEMPTQLMPNFMLPVVFGINTQYFGLRPIAQPDMGNDKIAVQFGSKYNTSAGITITQLIFNGEYIVGLQTAKIFKLLAEQNNQKAEQEIKIAVEQAYVMCIITEEIEKTLETNYKSINKLYQQTQELVNQRMAEQTKVDQVNILKLTIENQLNNVKYQKKLAYMMLKFQMGVDLTDSLILIDSLSDFISESQITADILKDFNINDNIDYKIAKTREQLALMDLKRTNAKFLPSISGIFNYSTKQMSDNFDVFDTASNWYNSSMIGITINIPLFGSGQKIAQRQQKKIALEETKNNISLLENQLNIQYEQARLKYIEAYGKYINAKKNLKLAQTVYNNTETKFKTGNASSFDLTQSQNQLLEKQASYYKAILDLLNAKFELQKIVNQ